MATTLKKDRPLVIVESPAKVRTIGKYLGKNFNVSSTVGHIQDLPKKNIGIDVENNFKPKYENIPAKKRVIADLKKIASNTKEVYLAQDPDREGEAIAWHTADILKKKGRNFYRVLFNELTKNGILKAMETPLSLNESKYNAQQTRRILDRLVGYEISPVLWKKVKNGLSAGRVQSVAVRIIADREREIYAFVPREYWSVTANLAGANPPSFDAKLVKKNNKKLNIPNKETIDAILKELKSEKFFIDKIVKKTVKKNPLPPFITSKLQQEAINRLRFSAKKTMTIAQQLYEGIDIGPGERVGLITYMRTDSTRIAAEAAYEAIDYVNKTYGKDYAINQPRYFANKQKAQDAHEAIRPTVIYNTPESISGYLTKEQSALYTLIWKRFVASQMSVALINRNSVSIKAGDYTFTTSGSLVKFDGFMKLYMSAVDIMERNEKQALMPELKEKEILKLLKLTPKQHFTQPPPRFSEGSLVKELEENGIGRPSTYANILSTIRSKGYVDLEKGYFKPSELGFMVNDLLVENFPKILDVDFTAKMENNLDKIEAADIDYVKVLNEFYSPFSKTLNLAEANMTSIKIKGILTDVKCPKCASRLKIKIGKNGPFLTCSKYPECKHSTDYSRDEKGKIIPAERADISIADGKVCDKCGLPMTVKNGKFGEFLACTGYPECRNTVSLNAAKQTKSLGVKCPEKGCSGEMVERYSKRGKLFYGCSAYPKCKFASWDKPVQKECPVCGASFMFEKSSKKEGDFISCSNKECGKKIF
ncbi:MAG: type I DNA topoisomerase [Deltaproteobacteria bacterium]|nr:type I DNA topoisomerase [Deltaproteobacteria bacterium]